MGARASQHAGEESQTAPDGARNRAVDAFGLFVRVQHHALVDAYLESERPVLRRFTADDAHLLIELDSDPAVMRYLTGGCRPRRTTSASATCRHPRRLRAVERHIRALRRALGVHSVWAETTTVNQGSRKVLEKAGLTLTDTLDTPPDMQLIEGSEHGGVRYGITREQWVTARG